MQLNNNDILKAIAKFAVSHKSDIIIVFFYNELKPSLQKKKIVSLTGKHSYERENIGIYRM